jgi:hypothetical protein
MRLIQRAPAATVLFGALLATGATARAEGVKAPSAAAETGAPPTGETAKKPEAETTGRGLPAPSVPPASKGGLIRDPAPRPAPALRVQSRYAQKAGRALLSGGVEYLARGDFFVSPGARLAVAYNVLEPLALEAQVSHYWSSLNAEAQRLRSVAGVIPDSHAPGWLMLAGGRYSIGYGKLLVGGVLNAIHLEPQAFAHLGMHVNDGDTGFSSDAGLGLLVYLTPQLFSRIDVALLFEREERSGGPVSVWGALPALSFGGIL